MTNPWRQLRRRILTPDVSATQLAVRGFHEKNQAAKELLETIGRVFLAGYAHAVEAPSTVAAEEALERVAAPMRGFAYEGATMGLAILDALPVPGADRVTRFLAGRARDHVYMAYVGVGWAMARLPRWRWSKLTAPDPVLRWLVLDGYGFHQAYFHTRRYVRDQYQEPHFPWPPGSHRWYANRAIDQGIGRALWFVGGAAPAVVADIIEGFPEGRQPDLYSGAGLAATYAGGADERELREFADRAGDCRPQLAQGSAFAAKARMRADLVTAHTPIATQVLCGMTPEQAARITDETRPDRDAPGDLPAFETWRRAVVGEFVARFPRPPVQCSAHVK